MSLQIQYPPVYVNQTSPSDGRVFSSPSQSEEDSLSGERVHNKREAEAPVLNETTAKRQKIEESQEIRQEGCLSFWGYKTTLEKPLSDAIFLEHIQTIPNLTELDCWVSYNEMTDQSIFALQDKATDIKRLKLNWINKVTERALNQIISNCSKLEELNLSWSVHKNEGLGKSLGNCQNLQKLILSDCSNLTDVALGSIIASIPNITYLNLHHCEKCIDAAFTQLLENPPISLNALEKLDMSYCNSIGDKGLEAIISFTKNIKDLDLNDCSQITGIFMQATTPYLTALEKLDLSGCREVIDEPFTQLEEDSFPSLRKLNLAYVPITYRVIEKLAQMHLKTSLQNLCLSNCPKIHWQAIQYFPGFSNLKALALSSLNLVKPKNTLSPLKKCEKLEELDLSFIGCERNSLFSSAPQHKALSSSEVLTTVQDMPWLKKLNVTGIEEANDFDKIEESGIQVIKCFDIS